MATGKNCLEGGGNEGRVAVFAKCACVRMECVLGWGFHCVLLVLLLDSNSQYAWCLALPELPSRQTAPELSFVVLFVHLLLLLFIKDESES